MSAGINPGYLEKLTPGQQAFAKRAVGVKFVKEFVWNHGQHCYIFGTTGSGKTQKGYWLVSWFMHTENVIWISSGKPNEILPLFTLGKNVRIIIPSGAGFKIKGETPASYEVVEVSSPLEAWKSVKTHGWNKARNKIYDTINIFEFRNTISDKQGQRSKWMVELFEILAINARLKETPKLFPCTIFLDEAQWLVTGRRVSMDSKRAQTSTAIIENALEMRSAGCRFVLFAQSYKNIPPAIRENMLFTILCRGANVEDPENGMLGYHCRLYPGPSTYQPDEGKFVYPDGSTYPNRDPRQGGTNRWRFPFYPNPAGCEVLYGRLHTTRPKDPEFVECIPKDIGVYSNRIAKPKPEPTFNRWDALRHGQQET